MIKLFYTSAILLTAIFVTGCDSAPHKAQSAAPIQAVKLAAATDIPTTRKHIFPAEVSALKTINVSFEVTGRLIQLDLPTGSKVKKGDVLAKIDPVPFQRRVKQAQAKFNQAKRELTRTKATFKKGLTPQSQLDNATTAYELAEIALNNAKQDLSYTEIKAPFDAQISERLVENNSFVSAGTIVARLQNISRFYFNINVPERLLSNYKEGTQFVATAQIISAPEKQFELEYVEHSTFADPITQTYKIVFATDANDARLLPGSRATVHIALSDTQTIAGLLVPFTAIVGDESNGFAVWRYNSASSQVQKVQVSVLQIRHGYALIESPLNKGDLVVVAGANKMTEGLVVKPYKPEF